MPTKAPEKEQVTEAEPGGPMIHRAMIEVMREVGAIGKDQRNTQQGFNYRGIDDIYNVLNPILAKHGVYMTSEIVSKTREERVTKNGGVLAFTCLLIRYRFIALDGSTVHTEVEGEGMDSGDKSSNKAMAVAHKYALLQAFCIPTKESVDPDAESHEVAPKKAAPEADPEEDPETIELRKKYAEARTAIKDATDSKNLDDRIKARSGFLAALKEKNPAAYEMLMEMATVRKNELLEKEVAQ